jgi:hypothetical protein
MLVTSVSILPHGWWCRCDGDVVLNGDEQLWQVENLGPPRFMLGSALRLGGNLILELREQCGPVGSGVLGRQLRAAQALKTVSQFAAAFYAVDAVELEDQRIHTVAAAH